MNKLIIINGPNLNEIGTREPEIYGTLTFQSAMDSWSKDYPDIQLELFQSNHEGAIIDHIQLRKQEVSAFIINAGAYTHTSIAIHDALKGSRLPVFEVHLTNIFQREDFRHVSYIANVAKGVICGFGSQGYEFALKATAKYL